MKIGITGTREGMNAYQKKEVQSYIQSLAIESKFQAEFHHGDCSGVDVEAATMAREQTLKIICHPPVNNETRGFFGGDEVRDPKGYLERDRNIVDETDFLLVVPKQNNWQPSGGTWYTHDYARKMGKPVIIFYPDPPNS